MKIKELQTNISHKYKCKQTKKNPKQNPTMYKKNHTSQLTGIYSRYVRQVKHSKVN